ncbi:MAG: hypothetical protein B6I25_08155 [Planctomycetales bacterium 4572_13]|nr:MAG: hypothetical protein B6I25_08155 [Planctomycetales bacterium 4572_13]
MFSRISIKWILPPLLVLPVVFVASVLTWLAYSTGRESADDLASQSMHQIHSRIEEHLSHLLDMPPAINELSKRMLATGELSLKEMDRNRVPVFEILNIFPAVSSVVIGAETGEVMWNIRYPGETTYEYAIKKSPSALMEEYPLGDGGQIGGDRLSQYAFQTTLRPWYRAAIEAGEPTWGQVYVWLRNGQGETLGIPYVEPVRNSEGTPIGVINSELTLADISAFLSHLQIGKTGKAFILERDGNLIATSVGLSCMKEGVDRLPAVEAADVWIKQATQKLQLKFGTLQNISNSQWVKIDIEGQPMRLVVSPYQNRQNLDWLIVTLVPDIDFLADIQRSRNESILLGFAAVLFMLLLSIGIVILMMRPFLAMVRHVRKIGQGQLEDRIELTDNLEMAELSDALNHMMDDLQDRIQLRRSLALAMEVQKNLLPSQSPQVEGLDIAGNSTYCDQTGGDYYDFLDVMEFSETMVVTALGDVMGHGVAAALLMATARGILRSHSNESDSLAHLMTHLNEHLAKDGIRSGRFMTMLLCSIDSKSNKMHYVSAGHDPPIVYDPRTDVFTELELGQVPLGIMEHVEYEENVYSQVRSGQVFMMATDGVWEMQNEEGTQYGKEHLCEFLRENAHLSASEISRRLYEVLDQFRGNVKQDDDVTFVIIKVQ